MHGVEAGRGKKARFALAAVSTDRNPCNLSNQWSKDRRLTTEYTECTEWKQEEARKPGSF